MRIETEFTELLGSIKVERVVFNALAVGAALPPNICAFGDSSAIAFRHGESLIREVDPPGL
jgi:hypothetical protein